jgi:nuclear receptor interaction protein
MYTVSTPDSDLAPLVDNDSDNQEAEDDNDESSEESLSSMDSDIDDDEAHHFLLAGRQPRSKLSAGKNVPSINHSRTYQGHCNVETTKDVNFFGLQDEYVVSGSDCGNLFIWDRKSSQLLNILEGDNEVVNVIQGHPYEPMLAVSGIDSTVKIFSPDGRQRYDAKRGIGIEESDHSTFSTLHLGGRRRPQRQDMDALSESSDEDDSHTRVYDQWFGIQRHRSVDTDDSLDSLLDVSRNFISDNPEESPLLAIPQSQSTDTRVRRLNTLPSRKRMDDEYRITNQNDMDRRRGGRAESSFLSRGMVALLAQRFRAQMNDMGVDVQELAEGDMSEEALEAEGCVVM